MNFKQRWKRFWTLERRSTSGFTLVELVVVIAILAILAGVAVPVYTRYIEKAEEAQDQLLIAAVNEAFAGGCLDAGIELDTVTDAKISVSEQMVFGVSSVTTDAEVSNTVLDQISITFNLLFEGNFDTPFVTENVMSLDWVPEEHSFVMDHENSVSSRIMLSSGKSITVSPEDMAKIQASAYADMGYTEVALVINSLGSSSEDLVSLARDFSMGDRFSAVLLANGLVDDKSDADAMSTESVANGLQMVTAKYLAGANEDKIANLMKVNLHGSTVGMLGTLASGTGGTEAVSAAATQYAIAQAFAENASADSIKFKGTVTLKTGSGVFDWTKFNYDCTGVQEFLNCDAAKADPIWALSQVQGTDEYKAYMNTEQYTNDLNGFVGTMSILGDNLGTTTNPGAVDIDAYFKDGINSQDASDALTSVLGN